LLAWAPGLGAAGVAVLFAVAEYVRSWSFYRASYDGPYLRFAAERLAGYYATALNNAAAQVTGGEPTGPLVFTLESALHAPVVGTFVQGVMRTDPGALERWRTTLLSTQANPEFTNVAPFALWVNDAGVIGAPLLAFALGAVTAGIHRGWARGDGLGLLLYPSWFVGLLELSRVYYWANQRYVPTLAAIVTIALLLAVPGRRRAAYRGPGPPVLSS
jgi:hypothetical protein